MDKVGTSRITYSNTIINQWTRTLLPTQILASATPCLSSIINGVVIGSQLPALAMGALGLVTPVTTLLSACATVISGGSRILCGNYIGRGETQKIDRLFTTVLLLLLSVGAVLTLLAQTAATPIAMLLGANEDLLDITVLYLRGLAIGIIPTLLTPCLMVFLQMGNESAYAFLSTVVMAVSNLAFVLINLFAAGGSMFGMGLATAGAQYASAAFLALRFVFRKDLAKLCFRGGEKGLVRNIIRVGFPPALAIILYSARDIIMNNVVLKYAGQDALVAVSTLLTFTGVFDALNHGVGSVAVILCSVFIGERDVEGLRLVLRKMLRISIILGLTKAVSMGLLGLVIGRIYGSSEAVIRIERLIFLSFGFGSGFFNMLTQTLAAPYQARGRVLEVNIMYILNAAIFPILPFMLAIHVNVFSLCFLSLNNELLTLLLITVYCTIRRKHLPKTAEDWMCLEPDFSAGKKLAISIHSLDEATNISERLSAFCKENGIEHRRSMLCGLCLEEMAINAAEADFGGRGKETYSVDINVCVLDGEVLIHLRDNTPTADPRTKLGEFDPADPCKGVGIRLVTRIAKEMTYQASFGLNVVSIKL